MIKNYFNIAWRNLTKHKVFTFINITGLAIGISASIVIYLIVSFDLSFDHFEKDNNRIYRVVSNFNFSGEIYKNSGVTYPMGNAVEKEVAGVEVVAPFYTWDSETKVSIPEKGRTAIQYRKQPHIVFANQNYFKLLAYNWLAGSPATALQQPSQVVLTASNAALYFPGLNASQVIGKEVIFSDSIHTIVSGVVKDLEESTDFNFKTFVSRSTLENTTLKSVIAAGWDNTNGSSQLFIKLAAGISPTTVKRQIDGLYTKYYHKDAEDHSTTAYELQPLSDVHFNADYGTFKGRVAHRPTLYGLLAIAAFLLLLACINFINLTTAQASQRAKEIGVRKTMGSSKKQLVTQFLSETFLITLFAALVSVALTPLLLKVFVDFIPEGLHFNLTEQPGILLFLLLLIPAVSLLSGFYPALILSRYNPLLALKNQAYSNSSKTRSAWLRKSLTVSQFVIAQVFIIATILVSKQINFTLSKDMGFKKDAILSMQTNFYDTTHRKKYVLIDKIKNIPAVAEVSLSTSVPSSNDTWSSTMKYKDGKKEIETDVQQKYADTNYLRLYQIKLLAGSNIPYSDTPTAFVINQTYLHVLGFQNPRDALGKMIDWSDKKIPIVGVVADFNQKSLHEPIKPLVLGSWSNSSRTLNIALYPEKEPGDWKKTIAKMEAAWKEIYPEDDFEYNFFDESIAKYYEAEQKISALLMWCTGLAIFISCLGLLGLIIFITNQRTKEIGVRKVVGATIAQIIAMLSKDFLQLVVIAFVIAIPISWWGAGKWLDNFAYKTSMNAWIFLAGGVIMFLLALIILCVRGFKAATVNPVKSLKTE